MISQNQNEYPFQPKNIKETFFSINEQFILPDKEDKLQAEITIRLGHNIENNLVNLTVTAFYRYTDAEPDGSRLAQIDVQNIFEVENMKSFAVNENFIIFPPFLITHLVSLSISHTRALFFKNLSGTIFQNQMMRAKDPMDVAKHFFPYMFSTKEAEN